MALLASGCSRPLTSASDSAPANVSLGQSVQEVAAHAKNLLSTVDTYTFRYKDGTQGVAYRGGFNLFGEFSTGEITFTPDRRVASIRWTYPNMPDSLARSIFNSLEKTYGPPVKSGDTSVWQKRELDVRARYLYVDFSIIERDLPSCASYEQAMGTKM